MIFRVRWIWSQLISLRNYYIFFTKSITIKNLRYSTFLLVLLQKRMIWKFLVKQTTTILLKMKIAQIESDQLLSLSLPLFGALEVPLFARARGVRDRKPSEFRYQFHFSNRFVTLAASSGNLLAARCSRKWYAAIKSIRFVSSRISNSIVPSLCAVPLFFTLLFVLSLRFEHAAIGPRTVVSRRLISQILLLHLDRC